MASFTAGTTFVDGVSNDVTAAKLGNLVTNATPTSGFIQDRTAETVVGTNDTILIGDASDSNNLKRMTVANILKAPLVSTSGTIDNLTTGTTTSTAQIVTSGTTATFNSTTGTIANLSATTSTFLGAITGSTNVVNIGSGQIYKDASGNVGIGTTTPYSKLNVFSSITNGDIGEATGLGSIRITNGASALSSDGGLEFKIAGDTNGYGAKIQALNSSGVQLAFANRSATGTWSERMRIDSSGNVGIGTGGTAAASKLDVYGVGNFQALELGKSGQTGNRDCLIDLTGDDTYSDYGLRIYRGSTGPDAGSLIISRGLGALTIQTQEAASIALSTSATTRLTIDSSGSLILAGSTAQKASGTTWSNPSDIRIKKNIRDYEKGLDSLMQVRVREWEYNGKAGTVADTKSMGVVADEVKTILPDTVSTYKAKLNSEDEEDSDIKKFDATEITWLLVKAVQELSAKVTALEAA